MYAVIEANGRQLKVSEGDVIRVDSIAGAPDSQIVFERVLLAHDGVELRIGAPLVERAKVTATIVRQGKDRKIMVFHYKPKKRIRKRRGHRQPITELRIEKISL
ncbi:MAG TPA: 50S ribosomal protein L21 [Candidatus Eremiobacteraceae bacterium]|nr:50S ribosomal protein L21 [Candidatus Eremiobacteraceae bacterium]